MRIVVNGSECEVSAPITVAELVRDLGAGGANGRGVAVAVEAQVVPHSQWEGVELSEGQRVEVLGAIQGG
jgi:sulfur carrier protein